MIIFMKKILLQKKWGGHGPPGPPGVAGHGCGVAMLPTFGGLVVDVRSMIFVGTSLHVCQDAIKSYVDNIVLAHAGYILGI